MTQQDEKANAKGNNDQTGTSTKKDVTLKDLYPVLRNFRPVIVIIGIAWLLVIPLYYLISKVYTPSVAGQFGDIFGFINSLFSGLAFAFIIITIVMQKQEMAWTREVLDLQKEELRMAREVAEEQSLTFQMQRFDNTFFKLLEHLQFQKENTRYTPIISRNVYKGQESFKQAWEDENIYIAARNQISSEDFNKPHVKQPISATSEQMNIVIRYLEILENKFFTPNATYFKTLKEIMGWIKSTQPSDSLDLISQYLGVLRSQLSLYEIYITFCYCGLMDKKLGFLLSQNKFFDPIHVDLFPHESIALTLHKMIFQFSEQEP